MGVSTATSESILERLLGTHPDLEVWWDSSPLVFETWRARMLDTVEPPRRARLADELARAWNPAEPAATLFTGVTTNPPLSLAAVRDDPDRWSGWIRAYRRDHPDRGVEDVFWALYEEIARLGAAAYLPLHEATGRRYGHLSVQVDPRRSFDAAAIHRSAVELARLGPNIMIKIPGTSAGISVLRALTRQGVSTNCTFAFTLPQFIAAAEEVQAGLLEARADGVDLTSWKSVITDMSARWENAPEFVEQGREAGVELSPGDLRWAGIAVFKEAMRVVRLRAYPSRMLICSLRPGPTVDGVERLWHLEHTAGADAVFTLPPPLLTDLFLRFDDLPLESRIWDPIPARVMARLRRVPYFNAGYDEDGLAVDDFDGLPPLRTAFVEFSKATDDTIAFVGERMAGAVAPAR